MARRRPRWKPWKISARCYMWSIYTRLMEEIVHNRINLYDDPYKASDSFPAKKDRCRNGVTITPTV
ncbi:MAG: hypothetical protein VX901_08170 [Candidatus Poribacteria bacterium]|nr:hypothetical protein [Candidatus Poribacteria bacterium]